MNKLILFFVFFVSVVLVLRAYYPELSIDDCHHLQVAFTLSGKKQNNNESIQDFVRDLVFFEHNKQDGRFIFIRSGEEISVPSLEVSYEINGYGEPEKIKRLSLGEQSARVLRSNYEKCWE